jgi:hypothetical protein
MPPQVLLDQLLAEELSGVTFVRDYLQLQFNPPPQINVYSTCSVRLGERSARLGDESFANLVIALIGRQVTAVREIGEVLTISLGRDASIELPFGDGTFSGAEAFLFEGRDKTWAVWP